MPYSRAELEFLDGTASPLALPYYWRRLEPVVSYRVMADAPLIEWPPLALRQAKVVRVGEPLPTEALPMRVAPYTVRVCRHRWRNAGRKAVGYPNAEDHKDCSLLARAHWREGDENAGRRVDTLLAEMQA